MIGRGQNFKQMPINVVGSSVFGRYPKISIEKTLNMFVSDNWMVPYAGYQVGIAASRFLNGLSGRGVHYSPKLNRLVVVIDNTVYLVNIFFDQNLAMTRDQSAVPIGTLQTNTGVVYIAENNKPQIAISDGFQIYIYDPSTNPMFQVATKDGTVPISFTPGYIDFHDTYLICAASNDLFYSPAANNTWRLSAQNNGLQWPDNAANIGLLQTKPDNVQAVVRFPSRGNMILVMGSTVSEPWYDVGYQLFPYQRSSSYSVDYGCINPATIASMDNIVVWLAQNEKSGPVILYSTGGEPQKISTDGIDYLFSQLQNPADSQGFLYRQDGHLFYHLNFYTDNFSLFYDFNTGKIYNASDENLDYFIAGQVAFFNNQYYFVTKNNGNLYAFDTIYTTYNGNEIPRIRTCKSVRLPSQEYFVANDLGFTIEQGETPYQQQAIDTIYLEAENGNLLITEAGAILLQTEDNNYLISEDNKLLISEQVDNTDVFNLISEQPLLENVLPRVDLSISIDGGAAFGSDFSYTLNPLGKRKNKIQWWQCGLANDFTPQFKFWGLGRFVATDGILNIRQ